MGRVNYELVKREKGQWIHVRDNWWDCSVCGQRIYSESEHDREMHHVFCSRCGSRMT